MNSFPSTETSTLAELQERIQEIVALDEKIASLEEETKSLKKRRDSVERLVVEDMATANVKNLGVAGRSWRIEWTHSMSTTEATKQSVMDALRDCGVDPDSVIQINAARLKAIAKELAEARGADPRQPWTAGTPLEGIAGEYVAPRLRSTKTG